MGRTERETLLRETEGLFASLENHGGTYQSQRDGMKELFAYIDRLEQAVLRLTVLG